MRQIRGMMIDDSKKALFFLHLLLILVSSVI